MRRQVRNGVAALLVFAIALIGAARADTTYDYAGLPYTSITDPFNALGTNMTGSVTFTFDTSGFTGTISPWVCSGFINCTANPMISLIELTSGSLTTTDRTSPIGSSNISLTSGQITSWNLNDAVDCPGAPYCFIESVYQSPGSSYNEILSRSCCGYTSSGARNGCSDCAPGILLLANGYAFRMPPVPSLGPDCPV
jgi:hypothetical protein